MAGQMLSRGGRRRRMVSEINVVPYIDVTLVLLIIFMVTAPMIVTGAIDLPRVGQSAQEPPVAIEVIIRKDGSHSIRRREQGAIEQQVAKAELARSVKGLAPAADTPIIVMAEREVRYELVAQALSSLQSAGVGKVGLAVRQQ